MTERSIGELTAGIVGQLVLRRFENFYIPEPNSGCWLWIGCTSHRGYGYFRERGGKETGCTGPAHRFSWRFYRGSIPEGLHVLHKCDTPACVNPDHLFLGTHQENMADRDTKGRVARGERQGFAKLSEAEVLQIFNDPRRPQRIIAEEYGVSEGAVHSILTGLSWTHVTNFQRPKPKRDRAAHMRAQRAKKSGREIP